MDCVLHYLGRIVSYNTLGMMVIILIGKDCLLHCLGRILYYITLGRIVCYIVWEGLFYYNNWDILFIILLGNTVLIVSPGSWQNTTNLYFPTSGKLAI